MFQTVKIGNWKLKIGDWKPALALLAILTLGLFLRLYNLSDWFNAYNDYDEGTYVLDTQYFMSGLLPYKDFLLVHPPLFLLLLAGFFSLFGSGFLIARYLSIGIGILSILLVYRTGTLIKDRKLGLVAALLVGVEPLLVFENRRATLMGSMLFLGGIVLVYSLVRYLKERQKFWLYVSGIALGLLLMTKLISVPLIIATLCFLLFDPFRREFWAQSVRIRPRAFLPRLALMTSSTLIGFFIYHAAFYYFVGRSFGDSFFSFDRWTARAGAALLAANTLFFYGSLFFTRVGREVRLRSRKLLPIIVGAICVVAIVSGPFIVLTGSAFFQNVIISHLGREASNFSSFSILSQSIWSFVEFDLPFFWPGILLVLLPFASVFLLRRSVLTKLQIDEIILRLLVTLTVLTGIINLVLLPTLPRYQWSVSVLVLLLLAIVIRSGLLKAGQSTVLIGGLAAMSFWVTVTYAGIDTYNTFASEYDASSERKAIASFLHTRDAHSVYIFNPSFFVLYPEFTTPLTLHDPFGQLYLLRKPVSTFVAELQVARVEYVIFDGWTTHWGGWYGHQLEKLGEAVEAASTETIFISLPDGEKRVGYRLPVD